VSIVDYVVHTCSVCDRSNRKRITKCVTDRNLLHPVTPYFLIMYSSSIRRCTPRAASVYCVILRTINRQATDDSGNDVTRLTAQNVSSYTFLSKQQCAQRTRRVLVFVTPQYLFAMFFSFLSISSSK